MLNAKDLKRQRERTRRDDAVLRNDAVLFAPAYEFPGQEQQRPFALIDEHKLVHRSAASAPRSTATVANPKSVLPIRAYSERSIPSSSRATGARLGFRTSRRFFLAGGA